MIFSGLSKSEVLLLLKGLDLTNDQSAEAKNLRAELEWLLTTFGG